MNPTLGRFLADLTGASAPVRAFPPCLRQTYAELMHSHRTNPATQGYEQVETKTGLKNQSPKGVAHRMYWWFPTHFFKFHDTLVRSEQRCGKLGQAFLLERPKVVFVDLGCGAGAASAAVLAMLEQYQAYCETHKVPVTPVQVCLIGLDPVAAELDMYHQLVGDYSSRLARLHISVDIQTISEPFPEGTDRLISILSLVQGHVLIVGMSNLINWIWNECDQHLQAGDLAAIERLQPAEALAIRRIADETAFNSYHIIGIATKSRRLRYLAAKLSELLAKVAASLRLANRPFGTGWSNDTEVLFENPEGSRWVRDRPQATSQYYVEGIIDHGPDYVQDRRFGRALSSESLEVAWAKVRSYVRYESLTDEVELRLFEHDLDLNLQRFAAACRDRCFELLNTSHDLAYQFPKGADATRPKALPRFEEQVISAAVCLAFAKELRGPVPGVSYSHRLSTRRNEFLYEFWFALHREYLSDIMRSLDENRVCSADVQSYYVHVPQSRLAALLRERITDSSRCMGILSRIVCRDCHDPHSSGYGIVQGHASAGVFANVMLQPVDSQLVHKHTMRGRYFRFADDFTVTRVEESAEKVCDAIQQELSALDTNLRLNSEKTFYGDRHEYIKRIRGSKELDSLSRRFRALLLPIFIMNRQYRRQFKQSEWPFAYRYRELLEGLGLYFTPEWLSRKVYQYSAFRRRRRASGRKWTLRWPAFSLTVSESGRTEWMRQFELANLPWIEERNALKGALSSTLTRAASRILATSLAKEELRRSIRDLRFSLYRLSVLGIDSVASEVVDLLTTQPWCLPPRLACQALARILHEDDLCRVLDDTDSTYVRAMALRALGKIRSENSVSLLAAALDRGSEPIERLMASEGLLDANLWRSLEFDRIQRWLENEAGSPYVQKNIVLILAQAYPESAAAVLNELGNGNQHPIVCRAIHYVDTKPKGENLLWKAEPDVLRKYRAKSYPLIEELMGDVGSYTIPSP